MPIYLVTVTPAEPSVRLVEAKNKAQALAHVAEAIIAVTVPSAAVLVALGAQGTKIESAKEG